MTNGTTETPDLVAIYKEIYTNVRETDQISLKLLAFVPTVSTLAAGWLALLAQHGSNQTLAVTLIAIIAAVITLGLYLWERRNVQTCAWLIERLRELEAHWSISLAPSPQAPTFIAWNVGKRDAERLIYTAAIFVWLVPILSACSASSQTSVGRFVTAGDMLPVQTSASLSDLLAAAAILVSSGTLAATFWLARRQEAVGIRPVLTFVYDGERGWKLQNTGNGPALNVVVAQKKIGRNWFNPVRVPPVPAGGEIILTWLNHVNSTGLGALYVDFKDRRYTSECGNDLSTVHSGHRFGPWEEQAIGRYWNHPTYAE